MNEMLTNGLHDELWINGARALPNINKNLEIANEVANRANAIACLKELYSIGGVSKEDYEKLLIAFIRESGYTPKIKEDKA
jgi:hypothetical protein